MFRKLLSALFSLVLMFVLATFCLLYAFQVFFSPSNLTQITKELLATELNKDVNSYQEIAHSYFDETLIEMDISPDVIDYFEEKELEKYFEKLFGENVNNILSGNNEMSFYKEDLEELFDNAIDNYEDKTGNTIDRTVLDDVMNDIEDTEIIEIGDIDENIINIVKIVNDKRVLITCGLVVIILMILIYTLKQNLASSLKSYGVVFIFNTIGLFLVTTLINLIIQEQMEPSLNPIFELLKEPFNNLAIISLVLSIGFIVSSIIFASRSKKLPGNIGSTTI